MTPATIIPVAKTAAVTVGAVVAAHAGAAILMTGMVVGAGVYIARKFSQDSKESSKEFWKHANESEVRFFNRSDKYADLKRKLNKINL